MPRSIPALRELVPARHRPLILELDLTEPLLEVPPNDPLGRAMTRRRGSLRDVLDGLRQAADDPHVHALIAKVGGAPMLFAQAQELRDAVTAFRRSGKRAVAWAETFGEFRHGMVAYYLATAFDEIWLLPSGDAMITGVAMEATFLRGALAKAGVTPQLGQRHEYKSAANLFTEQGFTAPHQEMIERLVASAMEQVVDGIAAGRRIAPQDVRAAIDRAPLTATEALDAKLVDRLGYRDEIYADVRKRAGEDAHLRFAARYAKPSPAERAKRVVQRPPASVALVYGFGAVRLGRSGRVLTGPALGSNTVAAAFRAAVKDERVKAIVFRVNSPGGSYVASDVIWRETVLARQAGKPLLVSMGDVAASGGYFVSMAADTIVAQPGTLTGSIGVVGGKVVVTDLLDRLGVGHDAVSEGDHARIFSTRTPFTERDWERINHWLDRVYDDFTAKVAQCRGLSCEYVHDIARGRVWTGADARDRRLVDELGGLEFALDLARRKAALPPDAPVQVFPKISPVDRLRPPESSEDPAAAAASLPLAWAEGWGTLAPVAQLLGLPATGPLTMPDLTIVG